MIIRQADQASLWTRLSGESRKAQETLVTFSLPLSNIDDAPRRRFLLALGGRPMVEGVSRFSGQRRLGQWFEGESAADSSRLDGAVLSRAPAGPWFRLLHRG